MLPDRPVLVLVDELFNYRRRGRKLGLADQFYCFPHNLTGVACVLKPDGRCARTLALLPAFL